MNLRQVKAYAADALAAAAGGGAQLSRACVVHANEISQNSGKYSENDAMRNGGNPYHVHMHGKLRKAHQRG